MLSKDLLKVTGYQLSFAGEYLWECYGQANMFDTGEDVSFVISNSEPKTVCEITIVTNSDTPYRWQDPKYIKAYNKEAKKLGVDPDLAWDDIKYIKVDSEKEILDMLAKHLGTENKGPGITNKENFTVKFDHRYVLEVNAESMDEARELATNWLANLSRRWEFNQEITFIDNYTVKETVERETK